MEMVPTKELAKGSGKFKLRKAIQQARNFKQSATIDAREKKSDVT